MNRDLPITALCIVSEVSKCPSNYTSITKTDDTKSDIDLWKDGLFGRKINRFICFTKDYPINDTFYVIEDVKLINEKDPILGGFVPIDKCQDNNDKAFQKKVLCIKVGYRHYTQIAVSDIIIHKNRRSPPGYSYVGEINGFVLCIKFSQIPSSMPTANQHIHNSASFSQMPPPRPPRPLTLTNNHSDNSLASIEQTFVVVNSPPVPGSINGYSVNANTNTTQRVFQSQNSSHTYNPLQGVPFQINPIYDSLKSNTKQDILDVERLERKFLSMNENLEKYQYDFKLEKSCLSPA